MMKQEIITKMAIEVNRRLSLAELGAWAKATEDEAVAITYHTTSLLVNNPKSLLSYNIMLCFLLAIAEHEASISEKQEEFVEVAKATINLTEDERWVWLVLLERCSTKADHQELVHLIGTGAKAASRIVASLN